MSQDDEVWSAFREAMRRDNTGQCTVSTRDFVAELEQRNSPHTLRAANTWIEMHITTFSDISRPEAWEVFGFVPFQPQNPGYPLCPDRYYPASSLL